MMKEVPYRELVKILRANGAVKIRAVGSHETWRVGKCQTVVPHHAMVSPGALLDSGPPGAVSWEGLVGAMTKRCNYAVDVEREPGWWIVRVPDLDDLTTQARRLADVEHNAREAIAAWLDVDLDTIEVSPVIHPPEDVVADLHRSKEMLDEAAAKQKEAAVLAGMAIHRLIDDLGLTLREAGRVVGLSHQRVAQLAGASPSSRPKPDRPHREGDPANAGRRLGPAPRAQGWEGEGGAPSTSKKRSSA